MTWFSFTQKVIGSHGHVQYIPYDQEYLRTHYKNIEEDTGRRYELADLNAPGGASKGNPRYEFLGITEILAVQTRAHGEAL